MPSFLFYFRKLQVVQLRKFLNDWGHSLIGKALVWQTKDSGFEAPWLHHTIMNHNKYHTKKYMEVYSAQKFARNIVAEIEASHEMNIGD